jgi:hypothetical protein
MRLTEPYLNLNVFFPLLTFTSLSLQFYFLALILTRVIEQLIDLNHLKKKHFYKLIEPTQISSTVGQCSILQLYYQQHLLGMRINVCND